MSIGVEIVIIGRFVGSGFVEMMDSLVGLGIVVVIFVCCLFVCIFVFLCILMMILGYL